MSGTVERWELSEALGRLAAQTPVPEVGAGREHALMAAFDTHRAAAASAAEDPARGGRLSGAWLAALAAAAMVLIAVGLRPLEPSRLPQPAVGVGRSSEFIPWPGASALPPLESGELVRMQLPVTMLPSLGVAPPASPVTAVTADVIVGQDGLARAVRFVSD